MADGRDDGRFLERWSRRKLDNEPEKGAQPDADARKAEPAGAETDERRLELQRNREAAESIDLDSLDAESDFTPFLKDGVPKALKAAAMKVLWRSNPVFANLDGLNDYDENFADPELIKKFAGSAWQVGKGYLVDEEETDDRAVASGEDDEPVDAPAEAADEQATAEADENAGGTEQPQQTGTQSGIGPDITVSDAAEDKGDEPAKVPLRQRLALDDWQGV